MRASRPSSVRPPVFMRSLWHVTQYCRGSALRDEASAAVAGTRGAAAAGGAIRAIKTTPLLTTAEGVEAMKKAAKSGYKAPRAAHAQAPVKVKQAGFKVIDMAVPFIAKAQGFFDEHWRLQR